MRVAVCISGGMRTYRDCWDSLNNLIGDLEHDIFLSTEQDNDSLEIGEIRDIFKPKAFSVFKKHNYPAIFGTTYPMCFLIYQADRLMRECQRATGVKYDWVIRSRPDIIFLNTTEVDFNTLDKNKLYFGPGYLKDGKHGRIPHGAWRKPGGRFESIRYINKEDPHMVNGPENEPKLLNDQIAIATPEKMKTYADTFEYMRKWSKDKKRFPFFVPEGQKAKSPQDIFAYQLWANRVEVEEIPTLIYEIKR